MRMHILLNLSSLEMGAAHCIPLRVLIQSYEKLMTLFGSPDKVRGGA